MEVQEYETLVGELETRVDRLRSLYDQYFMGIEKTVPSVSHKDVERRITILRKEQVRNTALRFRFQMIVQRFNTYQTHWQRICRQIEEGTYKRHVLKAKQKMAERERKASGEFSIDVTFDDFAADELETSEPHADLELDEPVPAPAPLTAGPYDDEDFGDKTLAGIPAPAGGAAPAPPGVQGAPHRLGAIALARVAVRPAAGAPPPPIAPQPAPQPTAPPARPQGNAPAAPAAPAARQPLWRKAEPKIEPPRGAPPTAQAAPKPAAHPAALAAPIMPPAKPAAASAPTASAPAAPKPAAPVPAKPAAPAPAAAKPAAARPAAKPGDLSDERMRQLYSSYVETKRAHKESTAGITYEQLSQTLRASSEKLREKHGKPVDFEVTIKDGKTILKPIIR